MKVAFHCEKCRAPLRAEAVKRVKCPKCNTVQVAPMESEEELMRRPEPEREVEVQPAPAEDRAPAKPSPPPPPPPRAEKSPAAAPTLTRKVMGSIGLDDLFQALDMALDVQKLVFFFVGILAALLGTWGLLKVGSVVETVVKADWWNVVPTFYFVGMVSLTVTGISRMGRVQLATGQRPGLGDLFSFIGRKFVVLIFLFWVFLVLYVILSVVLLGGSAVLCRLSGVGRFLGMLLALPVFLVILVLIFAFVNSIIMFISVATDETGILGALRDLVLTCVRKPAQLVIGQTLISIVGITMTFILIGIVCFAAAMANLICDTSSLQSIRSWQDITKMTSGSQEGGGPNLFGFGAQDTDQPSPSGSSAFSAAGLVGRLSVVNLLLMIPVVLVLAYPAVYFITAMTALYLRLTGKT